MPLLDNIYALTGPSRDQILFNMRVDIITLFPEMFSGYLSASIMEKAISQGYLDIFLHNIRDYALGKHRVTDEPPYGGGGGMILKPEPIFAAVEALIENIVAPASQRPGMRMGEEVPDDEGNQSDPNTVVLLSPQGRTFTQQVAQELSQEKRVVFICGRYEGVDERVRQHLATDEISIGDYVLTGGELAAMVIIDAVARSIPGVLGADGAAEHDSYAGGLLEGPHYTRPKTFRNWSVPDVLRSGHAAEIERWRREQALRRTWLRRPELLVAADLSEEDKYFLAALAEERIDELLRQESR